TWIFDETPFSPIPRLLRADGQQRRRRGEILRHPERRPATAVRGLNRQLHRAQRRQRGPAARRRRPGRQRSAEERNRGRQQRHQRHDDRTVPRHRPVDVRLRPGPERYEM
ncbi:hypothetical protein LTR28_001122, partial [Elasticomyces elasticus]